MTTALVAQWLDDPNSDQQMPGAIPMGHNVFVPFLASTWPALRHLMPVYYKRQDRVLTRRKIKTTVAHVFMVGTLTR